MTGTSTSANAGTAVGTDTYGIEVYGPDGSTVVWGSNVRQTLFQVYDESSYAPSTTKNFTCADANDTSKVIVSVGIPSPATGPIATLAANNISVTKSSTGFSVSYTGTTTTVTIRSLAVRTS